MSDYNITSLHLKRGAILVVNILEETVDSYFVRIFDVKNCKLNFYSNGDHCRIWKSMLK